MTLVVEPKRPIDNRKVPVGAFGVYDAQGDGMKVQLLDDRLMVKPDEGDEKVGGILIPENARERPKRGTVLASGGGKRDENGKLVPMACQPGDVVLFSQYAGQEITLDGIDVLMMKDAEVVAILNRTAKIETAGVPVNMDDFKADSA